MTRAPALTNKFRRSAFALAVLATLATLAAVNTLATAPAHELQLAARAGSAPVAAAPAQPPRLYTGRSVRAGDRPAVPTSASMS